MNINNNPRNYVLQALANGGSLCPERYASMLSETPENKVIKNLSPWSFLPTPERSVEYCSEVIEQRVLPFAQAVGQDLMACFVMDLGCEPRVLVINPWSQDKAKALKEELNSYEAWLAYAEHISKSVLAAEEEEDL